MWCVCVCVREREREREMNNLPMSSVQWPPATHYMGALQCHHMLLQVALCMTLCQQTMGCVYNAGIVKGVM